jgi:hypothetical protein
MNPELVDIMKDTGGTVSVFYWPDDNTWRATFLGKYSVLVKNAPTVTMALAELTSKLRHPAGKATNA